MRISVSLAPVSYFFWVWVWAWAGAWVMAGRASARQAIRARGPRAKGLRMVVSWLAGAVPAFLVVAGPW
ncbi:hypothetical protein GY15_03615 [Delftia sp. 670]|nr:hypothetical protein GY15_03615 [Delftia sp. 670]